MPKLIRMIKSFPRRNLPWRQTKDPYKILVSEVMLQQTQVERVVPKYEMFIRAFPTPRVLARAPLKQVLTVWSGLGYNRRAKHLHEAAKIIARDGFKGQKLPGVGPYTAAAVDAFAHNKPTVFVETNIRTVFIHFCFARRRKNDSLIPDAEILPLVREALKKSHMKPRDFYAALMDCGSYLKRQGIRLNSKSKHYTKQSKFAGSHRQLRGIILRAVLEKPKSLDELVEETGKKKSEVARALANLSGEGLVILKNHKFHISK